MANLVRACGDDEPEYEQLSRSQRKDQPGQSGQPSTAVRWLFPLSPAINGQEAVEQRRVDTEIGLTQAGNGWNKFDHSALGSPIQDAECAGYGEAQAARFLHPFALIHQHQVGFQVES